MDNHYYDWNDVTGSSAPRGRPDRPVELNDETLRDGLQASYVRMPSCGERVHLLHLMDALGIDAANIGLPGARGVIREDTLTLAKAIARDGLRLRPNCAARTTVEDVRPIVEIAQLAGIAIEACLFIGSSPIHMDVRGWKIDELLAKEIPSVDFAVRERLSVMFVTEDTTRSHPDDLRRLYCTAADHGAQRICISDTVGHAVPDGVARLVRFVRDSLDAAGHRDVKIDFHGHMDRGLGMWNAITAYASGADRIHGTALGIGERSGNAPMDQILVNLWLLGWIDRDLAALREYVDAASAATDVAIPPNYPICGRGAFETGTGVHADAIVKALDRGDMELADRVYSAVPSRLVGREQVIRVGPNSGRSNVTWWLRRHGIEATEPRVAWILAAAKTSDHLLDDVEIEGILQRMPVV